jgi:multisubunit Na+/H+ antiporter MnhC subunit
MSTAAFKFATRPEYEIETYRRSPGYNKIQDVARYMVLPSFAMGVMGLLAGLTLGIVGGVHIHDHTYSAGNIERLRQLAQGATVGGLAFVLAGISFAIARILGVFRKGGGDVQEAAGRTVQVLKRPLTAWVFLGLMMMGMMVVLAAATLHVIWGFDVHSHASAAALTTSAKRYTALAGVERLGIGMYLTAIAFGLASIIHVLRFQAKRLRERPGEPASS